jgi:hypothetical protein
MSVMTLPAGVSGARLNAKQAGAIAKTQKTRQHSCRAEIIFANNLRMDKDSVIESNLFIKMQSNIFLNNKEGEICEVVAKYQEGLALPR